MNEPLSLLATPKSSLLHCRAAMLKKMGLVDSCPNKGEVEIPIGPAAAFFKLRMEILHLKKRKRPRSDLVRDYVHRRRIRDEGCFLRFRRTLRPGAGSPWAFLLATSIVVFWAVTGPYFSYSDTWQLFINTGTTVITFLMVFLIQNTQNRETRVMALKLDELLRGVEGARTGFVNLDSMSDDELEHVQREFARLQEKFAPLVDDDLAHVEREIKSRKKRR
jgi:low affinity Fe/Cu permease